MTSSSPRRSLLIAGFLLTLVSSLSVHVVMLQGFNVPYPADLPHGGWARLPDRLLSVFGAITLYASLPDDARARPAVWRWALLFLVLAMIKEDLFRLPIMQIVCSTRRNGYPFVDALPVVAIPAVVAALIVLGGRGLNTLPRRLLATAVIGVPVFLLLAPALKDAFAPVLAWTAQREGDTLYNPPYDWHVEVPAYLTFIEPVLAAFAVGSLLQRRWPTTAFPAAARLALLLFALRGQVFSVFTNIAYARTDALTAMLSFGQFTLESLTLSLLTAATWWAVATRAGRPVSA